MPLPDFSTLEPATDSLPDFSTLTPVDLLPDFSTLEEVRAETPLIAAQADHLDIDSADRRPVLQPYDQTRMRKQNLPAWNAFEQGVLDQSKKSDSQLLAERLKISDTNLADAIDTLKAGLSAIGDPELSPTSDPRQTFQAGMEKPSRMPTAAESVLAGGLNVVNESTAAMTEPKMIAALAAGAGGPAIVGRAIAAGFTAEMAASLRELVQDAYEKKYAGDTQATAEAFLRIPLTGLFILLAGAHSAKGATAELGKGGLRDEIEPIRYAISQKLGRELTPEMESEVLRNMGPAVNGVEIGPNEQRIGIEKLLDTGQPMAEKISQAQKTPAEQNLAAVAPITFQAVTEPNVPRGTLEAQALTPLTDEALTKGEPSALPISPANESVFRQERSQVELQKVAEGNAAPIDPAKPGEPQSASPAPQTAQVTAKSPFFLRPRRDGVPDILDAIQELGGLRTPHANAGGEYDGYSEAMTGPARVLRRSSSGQPPDTLMQELENYGYRFESTDDLWSAISKASAERDALRNPTEAELANTFQNAALANEGRSATEQGSFRFNTKELPLGSRIKIKGEWFEVTGREGGTVYFKGERSGTQELPDNQLIHLDRRGFELPKPPEVPPQDIIDRLEAMKEKPGGAIQSSLIPGLDPETWRSIRNTAIDIVQSAIRLKRGLEHGLTQAIAYLRSMGEFDEATEKAIRDELTAASKEAKPLAESPIGIKNADTERVAQGMGFPPTEPRAGHTTQDQSDLSAAAVEQLKTDRDAGFRLAESIVAKPRQLDVPEEALLQAAIVTEQNEVTAGAQAVLDAAARNDRAGIVEGRIRQAVAQERYSSMKDAAEKAGTLWSNVGRFRQRQMEADYSLAAITRKLTADRVREDRPLTDSEKQSIDAEAKQFSERIADTEKDYQDYLANGEAQAAESEGEGLLKGILTDEAPASKFLLGIVEKWQKDIRADRLQAIKDLHRMTWDITGALPKLARIGLDAIAETGLEFAKWNLKMAEWIGEKWNQTKDEDRYRVFEAAQELAAKGPKQALNPKNRKAAAERLTKTDTLAEQQTKVTERIQAKIESAKAEGKTPDLGPQVKKLAKILVANGTRRLHPLIDQLHGILSAIDPALTWRDTLHAFTDYGQFKKLRMDDVSVELRKIRGEGQQTAKIIDMAEGLAPKATGIERRTPDQIERDLIKLVNEMKKLGGFTLQDSAAVLKSYLASRKTYYRNRLSDLREEIASRTQRPTPGVQPTDPELESLKAELKTVKAEHDSIFNAQGEKQIEAAIAAAEKSSARYEEILRTGKLPPEEGGKPLTSPELEAARARRNSLREQVKLLPELRAAAAAKELADIEARIEHVTRQIRGEAELGPTPATPKPVTPEMAAKKAELAELNKLRQKLRNAAKPNMSPEEIALRAYKARLDTQEADYRERISKGDFAPRTRKALVLDPEGMAKKAAAAAAKQDFEKAKAAYQYANRSYPERMADFIASWKRMAVLTWPTILGKLTAAAGEGMGAATLEEAAGSVLSMGVPKSITSKARRYGGGLDLNREVLAYTETITNLVKDFKAAASTGSTELDLAHGKPEVYPQSLFEWAGNLHYALKTPLMRNEWTRSFSRLMDFEARQGTDITRPDVVQRIGNEAYRHAQERLFMEDNIVVKGYNAALSALARLNPETGKPSFTGKAAQTLARFELPIVRIPTNLVKRAFEYSFGTLSGGARIARAFLKGVDKLPAEEADAIMRNLRRGTLGTAFLLYGWFNYDQFGGYYEKGKHDEADVPFGGARIDGVEIQKMLLHHPLLEQFQIGATMHRVALEMLPKGQGPKGVGEGAKAAYFGLLDAAPFVGEMKREVRGMDSLEGFAGEQAKSMIPGAIQWGAMQMDKDEQGNPTTRKPGTFAEHLKMALPGQRQEVPAKQ